MAEYILDVGPEERKFPERPSGKLGAVRNILCDSPLGLFVPEILVGWLVDLGDKRLVREIEEARALQRARIEAGELVVTDVTVLPNLGGSKGNRTPA